MAAVRPEAVDPLDLPGVAVPVPVAAEDAAQGLQRDVCGDGVDRRGGRVRQRLQRRQRRQRLQSQRLLQGLRNARVRDFFRLHRERLGLPDRRRVHASPGERLATSLRELGGRWRHHVGVRWRWHDVATSVDDVILARDYINTNNANNTNTTTTTTTTTTAAAAAAAAATTTTTNNNNNNDNNNNNYYYNNILY